MPNQYTGRYDVCGKGHEFTAENTYVKKTGRECLRCRKDKRKAYYRANRDKLLTDALIRQKSKPEISILRHGTSVQEFNNLLEAQEYKCASCGTSDPSPNRRFSIDHDHRCCPGAHSCGRCIRGLICSTCNRIAGMLEHVKAELVKAYLERTSNVSSSL